MRIQELNYNSPPLRGTFGAVARELSRQKNRTYTRDGIRHAIMRKSPDIDVLIAVTNEVRRRFQAHVEAREVAEEFENVGV